MTDHSQRIQESDLRKMLEKAKQSASGALLLEDKAGLAEAIAWEAVLQTALASLSRERALRKALENLCDAWDSNDGGRYQGNVTKAHQAARAALQGETK